MKIILFDASPNGALGWSWAVGSFRPGWTRIGVKSWNEASVKLNAVVRPGTRIKELQIWGHGEPGKPLIAGKPPVSVLPTFMELLARLVTPGSLVWFRSCSVFFGEKGRAFAERTANELNCRVAGHSHVIGPWQSGLFSVAPGMHQGWVDPEPMVDWRDHKSGPFQPRTIFCARMAVPESW